MSLVNQTSFVGLSPGLRTTSSELEAELEAEFRFEITEPFETIELIVLFNLSLSGDVDGERRRLLLILRLRGQGLGVKGVEVEWLLVTFPFFT